MRLRIFYAQAIFYDCNARLQARQSGVGVSTQVDDETGQEETVTVLTSDYTDPRPSENARFFTAWTDLPESEYVKGRMVNIPVREDDHHAWHFFNTTGGEQSIRFIAKAAGSEGNDIAIAAEAGTNSGTKYTLTLADGTNHVCDDVAIAGAETMADGVGTGCAGLLDIVSVEVYADGEGNANGEPAHSATAAYLSGGGGASKTRVDLKVSAGKRKIESILQMESDRYNFYTRANFEERDDSTDDDDETDEHFVSGRYWDDFSNQGGRTLFIIRGSVRQGKGASIFVRECAVATLAEAKTKTTASCATEAGEYYDSDGAKLATDSLADDEGLLLLAGAGSLPDSPMFYLGNTEEAFFTIPTGNWIQDPLYDD